MQQHWLKREQAKALGELDGAGSTRWHVKRKLALLRALDLEAITEGEAQSRYLVSPAEIAEWRRGVLRRSDLQPNRVR